MSKTIKVFISQPMVGLSDEEILQKREEILQKEKNCEKKLSLH